MIQWTDLHEENEDEQLAQLVHWAVRLKYNAKKLNLDAGMQGKAFGKFSCVSGDTWLIDWLIDNTNLG